MFDYEKNFMGVGNIKKRQAPTSFLKVLQWKFEYRMYNFLKQIGPIKGRICDIGCGGGEFLSKLKTLFPYGEYHGCDISRKAIELAETFSEGIKFKVIKTNTLPYPSEFFDLCISLNVLEHVKDIEAHLKEIHRILKPGGKFHICVPTEGEPFTMTWIYQKLKFGKNFTYKNWGHIHPELTHSKLIYLLKKSGFSIEKISYSLHFPTDFLNLFLYFLPKELLFFIYKEKTFYFTDAGINQQILSNKASLKGPLFGLREIWLWLLKFNEIIRFLDTYFLGKISTTASTVHLTGRKKCAE